MCSAVVPDQGARIAIHPTGVGFIAALDLVRIPRRYLRIFIVHATPLPVAGPGFRLLRSTTWQGRRVLYRQARLFRRAPERRGPARFCAVAVQPVAGTLPLLPRLRRTARSAGAAQGPRYHRAPSTRRSFASHQISGTRRGNLNWRSFPVVACTSGTALASLFRYADVLA